MAVEKARRSLQETTPKEEAKASELTKLNDNAVSMD